ncbi:MAG: ATP-dependent Clp protease proteolytic subunit, partial [Candidatus Saccharimonas sp.]|nr:ATP-dependent Clp protease proteolytic subunit [Planctomycetaceae bacterium]
MHLNRCDVATYCVGLCASMATVLLTSGLAVAQFDAVISPLNPRPRRKRVESS